MSETVKLRSDVTEYSSNCENYRKNISALSEEGSKLRGNIAKLTSQISVRQEEINKLTQNNRVMVQEIKDQKSYIEKLNLNADKLCTENSQLKKFYDDYAKENSKLWEQNKGLKSQLNEASGTIEELNNVIQVNQQQINNIMPENENLRHFVDDLKEKLDQSIEENKKIVQEQDVFKAQAAIKQQSSIDELKRLNDEIAKLKLENERLKVILPNHQQGELNVLIDGLKARNEERRKHKETKMRKKADEFRQKKITMNQGYSVISNAREAPLPTTSYIGKTRVDGTPGIKLNPDYTSINPNPGLNELHPKTEMYTGMPPKMPRRDDGKIPNELKSFMEDDDEEVSVAFEELMTEITKYETTDDKPIQA